MPINRFGCLTSSGFLITIVLLLSLGGFGLARGGAIFSPGGLNAQTGNRVLGGVRSHAEIARQCAACHVAPWDRDTMAEEELARPATPVHWQATRVTGAMPTH